MVANLDSNSDSTLEAALGKENEINSLRDDLRKQLTKDIEKDK